MLRTDFTNIAYTAEVLRIPKETSAVSEAIEGLLQGRWATETLDLADGTAVSLFHGFVASRNAYHRTRRSGLDEAGQPVEIPRIKEIRGNQQFLYDVVVAQRRRHVIVAVPFHGFGTEFFVKADSRLAGTRIVYQKLDITNLVVRLGAHEKANPRSDSSQIGVTRCHLAYEDPVERRRDIEQVHLSGANLRTTGIYQQLIDPVLHPGRSRLRVTPVLLGFASFVGGVKKSGAVTDRHGNFKIWVGPGLRQVSRLFELLDAIEAMETIISSTSNVPILQSRTLEDVGS